jgi:hypothetical protein
MNAFERLPGVKWNAPYNTNSEATPGSWTNITQFDKRLMPSILFAMIVSLVLIATSFPDYFNIVLIYGIIVLMIVQVFISNQNKKGSFGEFVGFGEREKFGVYVKQGLALALIFVILSYLASSLTNQTVVSFIPQSVISTSFPQTVTEVATEAQTQKATVQAIAYIGLGTIPISIIETLFFATIMVFLVSKVGIVRGIAITAALRILIHYGALFLLSNQVNQSPVPVLMSGVFIFLNAPYLLSQMTLMTKLICHSAVNLLAYGIPVFGLSQDMNTLFSNPIAIIGGLGIAILLLNSTKEAKS